jgi:hypothetical protein
MHYPSLNVYSTPIIQPIQQQPSTQKQVATQQVPVAKTAQDVLVEQAMSLDTPATSVGFLEHFQKHIERVETLQQRLSKFSVILMGAGVSFLAYGAMQYMES